MRKEYVDLVKKIKENNQMNGKELDEKSKLILNSILSDNDSKSIEDYRKKILFRKEYTKEDIIFGVVCVERDIINPIDFSRNVSVETTKKYDSYIITIDSDDNVIDNLLLKRFDIKEEAINYAIELSKTVEDSDIVNLINIIDITLEK